MSNIYQDNSFSIGKTPLIRLNRVTDGAKATVLAKIEGRGPGYSVKDRIGAAMIWDAEKRGVLTHEKEIIEPTSGNTGIALAYVAAARGYKLTLLMPETMSLERRRVVVALGANLILTPGPGGMPGAIKQAQELYQSDTNHYFLPQQFDNPANPDIHEKTTGPEIWDDTDGTIDVLVSGVGTGGTITGVSRYIKNTKGKKILSVAVEPSASPVLTQVTTGQPLKPGPHKIQGLGAGFVPKVLDQLTSIPMRDGDVIYVDNADQVEIAKFLGMLTNFTSSASGMASDAANAKAAILYLQNRCGPISAIVSCP